MNFPSSKRCSRWREFVFMFRQVLRAVMPWLSLQEALHAWAQISTDLSEPRRKRASQEEILLDVEDDAV